MESSMTWADFQDQPLIPPPPGRVPNFVHPESRAWEINVATSICLPFIALFAAMRLYAKAVVLKKWKWDDGRLAVLFLCALAWLTGFYSDVCVGPGKHAGDQPNDLLLSLKQVAGLAYLIFQLICEKFITRCIGILC